MITLESSTSVGETLKQLREQANVVKINEFSWKFIGQNAVGTVHRVRNEGYDCMLCKWNSKKAIKYIRNSSEERYWYLNAIYGEGLIENSLQQFESTNGTIMNSEFHNLNTDSEHIVKGTSDIYSVSYTIKTDYLLRFAKQGELISEYLNSKESLIYYDILSIEGKRIIKEALNRDLENPFTEEVIKNLTQQLLLLKLTKFWNRFGSKRALNVDEGVLKRMSSIHRLFKDFHNPPTIDDISKFVGLNVKQANQLFKDVYGTTPNRFFNQRRLEKARELILDSNLQIAEIGIRLGYGNMSHFSKSFFNEFGVYPKRLQLNKNFFASINS